MRDFAISPSGARNSIDKLALASSGYLALGVMEQPVRGFTETKWHISAIVRGEKYEGNGQQSCNSVHLPSYISARYATPLRISQIYYDQMPILGSTAPGSLNRKFWSSPLMS